MSGLTDISVSNYMEFKKGDVIIGNLESFSGLSEEMNIIEVKQYNRKFPRKLQGSGSGATVEITCSLNPSDEGYQALMASRGTGNENEYTVIYYADAAKVDSVSRSFHGVIVGYSESSEFDAQRTCTWTIAIDGEITYDNGTAVVQPVTTKKA